MQKSANIENTDLTLQELSRKINMNINDKEQFERELKDGIALCNETISQLTENNAKSDAVQKFKNYLEEFHSRLSTLNYSDMRQGTATNNLAKINSRKSKAKTIDDISGTAKITRGDFTVFIKNFQELAGLRTSTQKLIDALMIEFTETGAKDTRITLPLKKYMELRGLKDEKKLRKQVDEDLETLFNITISGRQKLKNGQSFNYFDMRLVIDKSIKNGVIQCTFHPDFYNHMKNCPVMPYHRKLLAIDDKYYRHAYYFHRQLLEHMNMNYGKFNQNIISVATLLAAAPEMPSYEEISKGDRHYDKRIIKPFEENMNKLEELELIKWEYCNINGLPLTDTQLNMDFDTFSKLLIKFELTDYPHREIEAPKKKVKRNL